MSNAPPVLQYARLSRRLRRRTITFVLAFGGLMAVFWFSQPFFHRCSDQWEMIRGQRAIAARVLPSDVIVYTEDERRIPALLAGGGFRNSLWGEGSEPTSNAGAAADRPRAIERIMPVETIPVRAGRVIGALQVGGAVTCWRKDELGNDLLVLLLGIDVYPLKFDRRAVDISLNTVTRAGWSLGSGGLHRTYTGSALFLNSSDRLTLWAPQPDSVDPRNINITCELNGVRGVIVETVNSNGYLSTKILTGLAKPVTSR